MTNHFHPLVGTSYSTIGQNPAIYPHVPNTEQPSAEKRPSDEALEGASKKARTDSDIQEDWHLTDCSTSIDDSCKVSIRFLVNIFGNYFANATPYEGGSFVNFAKYIKFKLENLDDNGKREIFGEDTGSVASLIRLFDSAITINELMVQPPITLAVAKVLEQVTHTLNQNKSCLIPGGWAGNPIGHAIYYEIIDQGAGKLSLYSYNRGEMRGNSYSRSNDRIVPFSLFKNIPREQILNSEFMKGIVEHRTLITNKYSSADVYVGLFSCLDKYHVDFTVEGSNRDAEKSKKREAKESIDEQNKDKILDPKIMMREQVSGVCSWKSTLALLQRHLSTDHYEKLRYYLKSQAMEDYIGQNLEAIKYPSAEFAAFEKCLEVYAYMLQNAFNKKYIPLGLLNTKLENIRLCRGHLDNLRDNTIQNKCGTGQVKLENQIGIYRNYPQINLPDYESKNKPVEEPIVSIQPSSPTELYTNLRSDILMGSIDDSDFGSVVTEQFDPITTSLINTQQMEIEPNTVDLSAISTAAPESFSGAENITALNVSAKVSDIMYRLSALQVGKNFDGAAQLFYEFIDALPFPDPVIAPSNLWQQLCQLNSKVAVDVLIKLCKMHHRYVCGIFFQPKDSSINPQAVIAQYKIVSIVDSLIRHARPEDTNLLGIDPLPSYDLLKAILNKDQKHNQEVDAFKSFGYHLDHFTGMQVCELNRLFSYFEGRKSQRIMKDQPLAFDNGNEGFGETPIVKFFVKDLDPTLKHKLNPEIEFIYNLINNPEAISYAGRNPFDVKAHIDPNMPLAKTVFSLFVSHRTYLKLISPVYYYWRILNVLTKTTVSFPLLDCSGTLNTSEVIIFFEEQEVLGSWSIYNGKSIDDAISYSTFFFPKFVKSIAYSEQIDKRCRVLNGAPQSNHVPLKCLQYPYLFSSKCFNFTSEEFLKIQEKFSGSGFNKNDALFSNFKHSTETSKFSHQQYKELLLLHFHPETSFSRLISFYKRNKGLLVDSDNMKFFFNRIFARIISEVDENPHLIPIIKDFIKAGLESSRLTQSVELAYFYTKLAITLHNLYVGLGRDPQTLVDSDLWSEITFIKDNTTHTQQQNGLCNWGELAEQLFLFNKSEQGEILMLESWGMSKGNIKTQDPKARKVRTEVYRKFVYQNPQFFMENISRFDPNFHNQVRVVNQWSVSYPLCLSSDNRIAVNCETGSILIDGCVVTGMEPHVRLKIPAFLYNNEQVQILNAEKTKFYSERFACHVYVTHNENSIKITIEGGENSPYYGTYHLIENSQEICRQEGFRELFRPYQNPTIWQVGEQQGVVLDDAGTPVFSIFCSQFGTDIYQTFNGVDYKLCNLAQDPVWGRFYHLDQETKIWSSSEGFLHWIEMPRLELEFSWNEMDEHWMSHQYPGYCISSSQYVPVMERLRIESYLVLENKSSGCVKVILPVRSDELMPISSGYVAYEYKTSTVQDENYLSGVTIDADIYLSYLGIKSSLSNGYAVAHALLKPQRLLAYPPSERTAALLLNIMAMTNKRKDSDPRAVACRIKSLYIYILFEKCNKDYFDPSNKLDKSVEALILTDIELYRKVEARLGYYALKKDEIDEIFNWNFRFLHHFSYNYISSIGFLNNGILFNNSNLNKQNFPTALQLELSKFDPGKNYLDMISITRPGDEMVTMSLYFLSNKEHFKKNTVRNHQFERVMLLSMNDPNEQSKFIRNVLLKISNNYSQFEGVLQDIEAGMSQLPNTNLTIIENLKNLIKSAFDKAENMPGGFVNKKASIKLLRKYEKKGASKRFQIDLSPSFPIQLIDKKTIISSEMEEDCISLDFEKFLEYIPPSSEKHEKRLVKDRVNKKLESLLDPKDQKGLYQKTLVRLKKDCNAYYIQKVNESKPELRLIDTKIPELVEELNRVIINRKKSERELKQHVLDLMQSGKRTGLKKNTYDCYKNADLYPSLSFEDLLVVYGKNQQKELYQEQDNNNELLYDSLDAFLNFANQTKKYIRTVQGLEEYLHTHETEELKREELKEKAYQSLVEPYNQEKDCSAKVLDYFIDIEVRQDQIDFLDKVVNNNAEGGLLAQAIPGFGKTSVILPLYAALVLRGDKLPLYVVPDELLPWITAQLRKSLGRVFDVHLAVLNESYDSVGIQKCPSILLEVLSEMKKSKKVFIVGVGMIHKLNIQINEKCLKSTEVYISLKQGEKSSDNLRHQSKLRELKDILSLRKFFKEECLPFGDEAHHLMNILNETNHPFGTPKPMPIEERAALFLVYDVFLNTPKINDLVRVNFDQDHMDLGAAPFTSELYQSRLKFVLVDELIQKLRVSNQIDQLNKANLSRYFSSLSDENMKHLRLFLLNDRSELKNYSKSAAFVKKITSPQVANFIYLLREEVERLLSMTLGTKWGEGYALRNGNRAIPAKNGEILHQAQFSNAHEAGNYTIQGVVRNGVVTADVKKVIEEFRNHIRLEMSANNHSTRNYEVSIGYHDFISLSPRNSERNVFNLSETDYQQIANEINASKSLLLDFVFKYYLREIKSYPEKVSSNCYSLGHLFPHMRAVSGTISPTSIYPPGYEVLLNEGADGKSLFVLFEQTMQLLGGETKELNIVSSVPHESPEDLLEGVKNLLREGYPVRLITDAAGYMNGVSIHTQVKSWLEKIREASWEIRGVCHHQEGLVVVYDGNTEATVSEEQSMVSSKEILTILQQPYVTGTDIPQMGNAVEVVTVGITTTYTLLIQAIWRARLIHLNQKLRFIISNDTGIVIRNQLGLEKSAPVLLEHLVMFTLMNEIKIQEEENVFGIKLKMRAYIQNTILDVLTTYALSFGDTAPIGKLKNVTCFMHDISSMFKTISQNEARFAYSGEVAKRDTHIVLNEYKEMLLQQYEELFKPVSNPNDFRFEMTPVMESCNAPHLEEMEKILSGFIEQDLVPPRIDINPNPTFGTTHVTHMTESQNVNETAAEMQRSQEISSIYRGANWQSYPPNAIPLPSRKLEEFIRSSTDKKISRMSIKWKDNGNGSLNISINMAGKTGKIPKNRYQPEPFNIFSKRPDHLLMIYDSKKRFWECTILDIEDFAYCKKRFAMGLEKNGNNKYFLYDLTLGFYHASPQTAERDFVEQDATAAQLRALVRFYGGRIDYTTIEVKELLKWLNENGKEELLDFFENTIVHHHPNQEDLVRYMRSLTG